MVTLLLTLSSPFREASASFLKLVLGLGDPSTLLEPGWPPLPLHPSLCVQTWSSLPVPEKPSASLAFSKVTLPSPVLPSITLLGSHGQAVLTRPALLWSLTRRPQDYSWKALSEPPGLDTHMGRLSPFPALWPSLDDVVLSRPLPLPYSHPFSRC